MQRHEKNPTVRDVLYVLFKYKMIIIIFTASSVVMAILYSYLHPPQYEAVSKILVKIGRDDAAQGYASKPSPVITNINYSEILNSETELLKGRYVIEEIMKVVGDEILNPPHPIPTSVWQKLKNYAKKVLSDIFDISESALSKLGLSKKLSPEEKVFLLIERGLRTEVIKSSNSIKVSFQYSNPELAAKIVNTAVTVYIRHRVDILRTSNSLDFFARQTHNFNRNLRDAEHALKEFKDREDLSSLEEQRHHLLSLNADIKGEITKTDIELSRLDEKINKTKSLLSENSGDLSDNTITNPSQVVDSLKVKLMDLRLKRASLSTKYYEDNPFLASVNKEIENTETELKREEIMSSVSIDRDSLQKKREKLNSILDKSNAELKKINDLEYQLQGMVRKVRQNEELYNTYFEKEEEARIMQAMDTANITNVRVIEFAYPPIMPARTIRFIPQKIFTLLMAFAVGMLGSISMTAFLEMFDHSFKSSDDVEEYMNLPVLGTISDTKYFAKKSEEQTRPVMPGNMPR